MQQAFLDFQSNLNDLLQRCNELLQQNAQLRQVNEQQRNEIMHTHKDLELLKEQYKDLQMAHALSGETEDKEQARRKLTSIIQMVDKAIDKLSE